MNLEPPTDPSRFDLASDTSQITLRLRARILKGAAWAGGGPRSWNRRHRRPLLGGEGPRPGPCSLRLAALDLSLRGGIDTSGIDTSWAPRGAPQVVRSLVRPPGVHAGVPRARVSHVVLQPRGAGDRGQQGHRLGHRARIVPTVLGDVVLTARDVARGQAAVQQLQAEGLSPRFHQLDIDDLQSIRALRDFLRKEYGGLNVLVNNAAVAFKSDDPMPFDIKAEMTLKTNFFATRNMCNELLPIMKPHGRVVNISSLQCLRAFENCSEDLQEKFRSDTLTEGDLVDLMKKFVEDTKNEVHEREGWPNSPYGVSKLGVTVLSRILARRLDEKRKADRILVNACCPGPVQTDMDGKYSIRTVEEGVETPVYLALLPPDATEPQGQLVHDKVVQNW
uniref:carbonyl reductase (NADPH) n=1 Tax=Macaca fascicularis TaxID=9541 RepID=G7P114_MACFA